MLTPTQEKWLEHLNDMDSVEIYPADSKAREKFLEIKRRIQSELGEEVAIEHRGSTSLGISGQGELDVYIPVLLKQFDEIVGAVERIFGKPRSLYPLERARFVTYLDKTKVELFVINEQSSGWIDCCRFQRYLKGHPDVLEAYRILKETGRGLSTQKYYRRKIEFINEVLERFIDINDVKQSLPEEND